MSHVLRKASYEPFPVNVTIGVVGGLLNIWYYFREGLDFDRKILEHFVRILILGCSETQMTADFI